MHLTSTDRKYLRQIKSLASKSRCLRAKQSAIIVDKNGQIISASCNDPHACYDCNVIGCIRNIKKIPSGERREICYGLCAEQYAIAFAAKYGKSVQDATIYVTSHPCRICESLIAESGIKRVVYLYGYPDVLPNYDVMKDYGIKVLQVGKSKKLPCPKKSVKCDK